VLEPMLKCPDPDPALNWPAGVKFEDLNPDKPAGP
jgi:hypothetical protein